MPDINIGAPLDSDLVSQYPANERASRSAISAIIGAEHSSTTGRHKIGIGNSAARDAITNWERGSVWVLNEGGGARQKIQVQQQASSPFIWTDQAGEFGSGVHMLFTQAAAPTGWVQDTTWNDRVLRVVSGGTGGTIGGSWTISGVSAPTSGWSTGGTTPLVPGRLIASAGSGSSPALDASLLVTDTDNAVVSTGAWRPSYLDCISCQKI